MKSAMRSLGRVLIVMVIVSLVVFVSRAGGPSQALSASFTAEAAPQIKMYLRVDGIGGELTDDLHKGCLEVRTYEHVPYIWGDPHITEGGKEDDLRAGRLTVTKPVGSATPALLLQYCKQTPIRTVTLELWREGGPVPQKVMVYTHHDCAMNAIRNMKSAAADDPPLEELNFVFSRTEWVHTEYDANGKPKGETRAQWDGRATK